MTAVHALPFAGQSPGRPPKRRTPTEKSATLPEKLLHFWSPGHLAQLFDEFVHERQDVEQRERLVIGNALDFFERFLGHAEESPVARFERAFGPCGPKQGRAMLL